MRLAVLLLLLPAIAGARVHERVVWADVIDVEPLIERERHEPRAAVCFEEKPIRASGLGALLAWDLAADCSVRETAKTRHYRVRYAWAGREYQHVTDKHPGNRIALRLEVELADR